MRVSRTWCPSSVFPSPFPSMSSPDLCVPHVSSCVPQWMKRIKLLPYTGLLDGGLTGSVVRFVSLKGATIRSVCVDLIDNSPPVELKNFIVFLYWGLRGHAVGLAWRDSPATRATRPVQSMSWLILCSNDKLCGQCDFLVELHSLRLYKKYFLSLEDGHLTVKGLKVNVEGQRVNGSSSIKKKEDCCFS